MGKYLVKILLPYVTSYPTARFSTSGDKKPCIINPAELYNSDKFAGSDFYDNMC